MQIIALAMLAATAPVHAQSEEEKELRRSQDLYDYDVYQLRQNAADNGAGRSDPVVGGRFARSFLIPGTEVSLRIGGQGAGTLLWYLKGATPGGALNGVGSFSETYTDGPGGLALLTIPLNGSPAHSRSSEWIFSGKQSRIFFDARTPSPYGEVKAFIELDFSASNTDTILNNNQGSVNGYIPRLRQGYAALGGVLLGQTWSTFMDLDAEPELLDAGGRAPEMPVVRVPMVRYTYPLPYGVSIAIAAENPAPIVAGPFGPYNTDANQIPSTMSSCAALTTPISGAGVIGGPVATNITNACFLNAAFFNPLRDVMPNFVLRGRIEQAWGHLQLGFITEGLELNDGMFLRKSYIGYGGSVSGNFFTWGKDSLIFGLIAGNGLLGVSSNFGGALAGQPFIAADSRSFFTTNRSLYDSAVLAKTIDTYSPHIGYQHWWTPELRSTVDFSMLQAHVSSFLVQASGRNANPKRLSIGHANLLWSPAAFVDLGLEGARGERVSVGNIRGNSYTIQSSLKFRF